MNQWVSPPFANYDGPHEKRNPGAAATASGANAHSSINRHGLYISESLATRFSIGWRTLQWLRARCVPDETLSDMASIVGVRGYRNAEGWFDEHPHGKDFLAFYNELADDAVLWSIETGDLATLCGRSFALGEDNIANAGTYSFDCYLHIYADPLEWLRDNGRGIVVLDWSRAFDMLRNAPRVAVAETLLATYREAMKPRHMPELAVLASAGRLAA